MFWDDARLVAELAGHGTHATRRRRQSDAERAARLGLQDWRVVEFTYEDVVERPTYVVDMIRAYLDKAGPSTRGAELVADQPFLRQER
jgi:very-short-patch-repair endonuclease